MRREITKQPRPVPPIIPEAVNVFDGITTKHDGSAPAYVRVSLARVKFGKGEKAARK